MNRQLFLKNKYVWLSLLSLLGQIIIISLAFVQLVFGDVSSQRAIVLVLIIIGFVLVSVITVKRLVQLAKLSDLPER